VIGATDLVAAWMIGATALVALLAGAGAGAGVEAAACVTGATVLATGATALVTVCVTVCAGSELVVGAAGVTVLATALVTGALACEPGWATGAEVCGAEAGADDAGVAVCVVEEVGVVLTAVAGVAGALAAGATGVVAGAGVAGAGVEVAGLGVEAVGVAAVAVAGVLAAALVADAAGEALVAFLAAPVVEATVPPALWTTDWVAVGPVGSTVAVEVEVEAALALDRPKTQQIANRRIAPTTPASKADERAPERVMASAEHPGRPQNDFKAPKSHDPLPCLQFVDYVRGAQISNRSPGKCNRGDTAELHHRRNIVRLGAAGRQRRVAEYSPKVGSL
jgi:hypothetical protein